MKIEELEALLDKAERTGSGQVTLKIGHRKAPGMRVRLTPRSGPIGELLCETDEFGVVAAFEIKAVRRWLEKAKEIKP